MSRLAVSRSAAVLEQLTALPAGRDLDVRETVDSFARDLGRAQLRWCERIRPTPIAAWVDVERGDHPGLALARSFLDEVGRLGVNVNVHEFAGTPDFLKERRNEPSGSLPLNHVAAGSRDHVLMILSRGVFSRARHREALLPHLRTFRAVIWLDLGLHANSLDRTTRTFLKEHGVRYVNLTLDGVATSAAHGGGPLTTDVESVDAALSSWALCAALVRDPTWDHLDSFRSSREIPEIGEVFRSPADVERLIAWFGNRTTVSCVRPDGRGLSIPSELANRIILAFRKLRRSEHCEPLEVRARRLLVSQLSESTNDSGWTLRLKRYLRCKHQFALAPGRHWRGMRELFQSEFSDEAKQAADEEIARWHVARLDGKRRNARDEQRLRRRIGLKGTAVSRTIDRKDLLIGRRELWWVAIGFTLVVIASIGVNTYLRGLLR